jgi:hypothetical protein
MDFVTSTEAAPRGTFYTEVVAGPRPEEEEERAEGPKCPYIHVK